MIEFIRDNYIVIVLALCSLLVINFNSKLFSKNCKILKNGVYLILLLIIFEDLEFHFSRLDHFVNCRLVFFVICNIIKPLIAFYYAKGLDQKKIKNYMYIPILINALVYISSFFCNICVYFTSDNVIHYGILGYFCKLVCFLYFLLFLKTLISILRKGLSNIYIAVIYLSVLLAYYLNFSFPDRNNVHILLLVALILYYLFLYIDFTKKDALTKLNNRFSFYDDLRTYDKKITGMMSIDMNGLKKINDSLGHSEGDKYLIRISDVLDKYNSTNYFFYRIGGDEFSCICINQNKTQIMHTIREIKKDLREKNLSVSIGYSVRQSFEDIDLVYKSADDMMYLEKEKFYKNKNSL